MARRSLAGQVVVVTGAARGLGELVATGAADRGATVALLGLEPGRLAEVAARCGGRSAYWEVDVTDQGALERVAADVTARLGRVDVVLANAGIACGGPLLFSDPAAFDRTIEVNLMGSVRTVRAFLPAVVDSRGYVLQVASAAAFVPLPFMAAYCASKSGVEAFAHCVRSEVAHHGVRVGVAYLSWTDTDMVRGADAVAAMGDMRSSLPGPLGRTYPVEPAVEALLEGIERRAAHVYAQPVLRVMPFVRGLFPGLIAAGARRRSAAAEEAFRKADITPGTHVGAGGQADDTALRARAAGGAGTP